MITCKKCELPKDESSFRIRKDSKNGYQYWCKECENNANKKRYKPKGRKIKKELNKDEVKQNALSRMLKHRYGITYEQYVNMYNEQSGLCAICEKPRELGGRSGLYIDHDHNTNKVRGLLCPGCNYAIGVFRENKDHLNKAIEYLSNNSVQKD